MNKKFSWYYNRLRAMSTKELIWRVNQKRLQLIERKRYAVNEISVTSFVFCEDLI